MWNILALIPFKAVSTPSVSIGVSVDALVGIHWFQLLRSRERDTDAVAAAAADTYCEWVWRFCNVALNCSKENLKNSTNYV